MNDRITQDWIQAAIGFEKDPNAKMLCPICKQVPLNLFKVPSDHGEMIELDMVCPVCGARNTISYKNLAISITEAAPVTIVKFEVEDAVTYSKMKDTYARLLSTLFKNSSIDVITLTPGNDLFLRKGGKKVSIGNRRKGLINENLVVTPPLLENIAESFEFELGGMIIMKNGPERSIDELEEILDFKDHWSVNEIISIFKQFVYTENDGHEFMIVNCWVSRKQIEEAVGLNG